MRPSIASALRRGLCATALVLGVPAALAWSEKPVRLLVPAPAGGTVDVDARIVGDQLARRSCALNSTAMQPSSRLSIFS